MTESNNWPTHSNKRCPVVSTIYGILVGNWSGTALAAWNASIESRVSKMSNILSQQIPIRMMGFGPVVSRYAQKLRKTEMECSRQFRICTTTTMTGGKLSQLLLFRFDTDTRSQHYR